MNKLTTFFLIAISIIFVFIFCSVVCEKNKPSTQFKDYEDVAYNNDIYVLTKIWGTKEDPNSLNNNFGKEKYNFSFNITKTDSNSELSNIKVYLAAKYQGNIYRYAENVTAKESKSGELEVTPIIIPYQLANLIDKEVFKKDNTEELNEKKPEEIYVRVAYSIKKDGETTFSNDELKYKYIYDNEIKLDNEFKEGKIKGKQVLTSDNMLSFNMNNKENYVTADGIDCDRIEIKSFIVNSELLDAGDKIVNMYIKMYAKPTSDKESSTFSKQIVNLFDFNGSISLINNGESMEDSTYSYVATALKISDIYVIYDINTAFGKNYSGKIVIPFENVPRN